MMLRRRRNTYVAALLGGINCAEWGVCLGHLGLGTEQVAGTKRQELCKIRREVYARAIR